MVHRHSLVCFHSQKMSNNGQNSDVRGHARIDDCNRLADHWCNIQYPAVFQAGFVFERFETFRSEIAVEARLARYIEQSPEASFAHIPNISDLYLFSSAGSWIPQSMPEPLTPEALQFVAVDRRGVKAVRGELHGY